MVNRILGKYSTETYIRSPVLDNIWSTYSTYPCRVKLVCWKFLKYCLFERIWILITGTDELPDGEEIIIKGNNQRSWNRGHISPDADFVMDYQQDATYFFINIAPQFGTYIQLIKVFYDDGQCTILKTFFWPAWTMNIVNNSCSEIHYHWRNQII